MLDNVNWQQTSTNYTPAPKPAIVVLGNEVKRFKWLWIVLGIIVLIAIAYWYGTYKGAKSESLKHQYKAKEDSIHRVYDIKKSETKEVLSQSKNSVTRAENIQRSIPKFAPTVKDTTDDYKKEYIKKFEP